MANRTLQFYGYAYGTTPVQLNAHINGEVVFSGSVPTVDEPLPIGNMPDMTYAPVLFTVENSSLVPTEFSGSLPMTISIATGDGIALSEVYCNYMGALESSNECVLSNSSITGSYLTVGTVTSGTIVIGQSIWVDPYVTGAWQSQIQGGSGTRYYVTPPQTVSATTITAATLTPVAGNATAFLSCYDGIPTNSDNTPDPRSSVTIDGVTQNPNREGADGAWTWIVPTGSTIAYNLNIALGNVA
jgi:hypothetical protein